MYEFIVTVGMQRGGKQVFIASAKAGTKKTEDQIRYLVKNSLSVLSIAQIKMGD